MSRNIREVPAQTPFTTFNGNSYPTTSALKSAVWTPQTPIDLESVRSRHIRYGRNRLEEVTEGYIFRTTKEGVPYRLSQTDQGDIRVEASTDQDLQDAVEESRIRFGEGLPYSPLAEVAERVPAVADQLRRMPGYRVPVNPASFEVLISSISAQQVNMKWAHTTLYRLIETFGTRMELELMQWWRFPSPERLALIDPSEISALQYTNRKASYIVGVAKAVADGCLSGIEEEGNETVIRRLVALRGVGVWTAEWFLARCLGRPDAVAAGDLGVRKVVSRYVMGVEDEVFPEPEVRAAVESWGDGTNWAIHLLLERWAEEHAR
ncbi:MAG: DNA-3-methyladenine glycosylase 2 family protein [Acidimicrobiia bacterium]|nr:DNA-3-methyladenine glycosylase 2 family protein [Acidimicrobiia bacterium]MYF27004.1 DNA-3-methyladenine glycosylase 2 family protein [Acidimicrobiia bacterium]